MICLLAAICAIPAVSAFFTDHAVLSAQIKTGTWNYSLAIDPKGGTWNGTTNATLMENLEANQAVSIADPTRTGYTFTSWTAGADNKGTFNSTTKKYTVAPDSKDTLTANWRANTYKVAFNGNGATGGTMAAQSMTYNAKAALTTNTLTRTGYDFAGWNTSANGTGTAYADGATVTNLSATDGTTVTLYAQWKAHTYSITYTMNGGTGASSNPTSYTIESADIALAAPTRTGYMFAGWTGSNGTTAQTSVTIAKGSSGDKTYSANWTANTYTLTYNANGGAVSPTSKQITYDSAYGTLATPTRTGYDFAGWYTSASGGTQVTASTVCTGNATVYAHWTAKKYTVSFNANGGTGSTASVSATYDSAMPTISNKMSRTGYTFAGYYDAASGGTQYYTSANASARTWNKAANTTLYAHWTANKYTVSYNANGGAGTMANSTATYGSAFTTVKNAFTRTGYTFNGWNEKADGTGTAWSLSSSGVAESGKSWTWSYTSNITLYAQWKPVTYTISYALNGGTNNSANPSSYTIESAAITLKDPTKTGYTFAGWKEGNTIAKGSTGNKTFTAQWTPIPYTITYALNGGTNSSANPSSYTIESADITLSAPTRAGYTFKGWTGSNGTTAQTSVTIAAGSTGAKNYTANWTANTNTKYTVIHQQEQLDGTYTTVATENLTGTTDTTVTPAVKGYTGFTSPAAQSLTIKGDGTASITYKYTRNSYTITRQYRLQNADGTYGSYTQIDSKSYKYGASVAAWSRASDTTYKAASIAAYTVQAKNDTLSVNVDRNTSTNNKIQYRLQNADGSYGSYTTGWSGTLRYGESHTWSRSADTTYKAAIGTVSYNGGTVSVNVDRNSYTLTYNGNGGTTPTAKTALYGAAWGTLSTPTRTGYTFAGWFTAASGGTQVTATTACAGNQTVYAHWTINSYTLTYNANGGSVTPASAKLNYGAAYGTLPTPTRTGYTFGGWYTAASGGTAVSSTTTIGAGNVTIYAHWTANNYTVTYEDWFVDASNNRKVKLGSKTASKAMDSTVSGSDQGTDTTKGKYYANYVYKSPTSAKVTTSGATVYRYFWAWTDLNIYYADGSAQNGGTVAFSVDGTNYTDVTNETNTNTVQPYGTTYYIKNIRPKNSYETLDRVRNLTLSNGVYTYTPTAAGTTMSIWMKYITYPISYTLNGGSVSGNPTAYNYSTAAITLKNPTRTGYTFAGWTGSNGTTASTTVTIAQHSTGNKTYTANWKANSYTIAFNGNGSTGGSTANESMTFDTAKALTANGFTRTGYTFKNWNTKADGSGTSYANSASVKNLATSGTITLYAQWTLNTYTISYNLNGGTVSSSNPTSYNVTSTAITLNNPTRTGYTFAGWTGSNGTTAQTSVTIAKGSTGNKSYTANWKANTNTKYTVIHQQEQLDGTYKTYETQNLTGTTDAKVTPAVKSYTGFKAPTAQTITIAANGTASVTYKYMRNSYTVTRQYRLENADGSFSAYTRIDSKSYKYGSTVAAWSRAADTTYKAASIGTYTVGAKNDTLSVDVMRNTSANNVIRYRLQNADGSYPSGYTTGWSGTLRYGQSHTWSLAQSTSHAAASKTVAYNGGIVSVDVPRRTGRLVINANGGGFGGSSSRTTSAIRYGSTGDNVSPMPTRTGYTLNGLYTAATGGTKVVNADGTKANDGTYSKSGAWQLNSDVPVYAQWTVNKYTVTLSKGQGIDSVSGAGTYAYGQTVTISATVNSNYNWSQWNVLSGTVSGTLTNQKLAFTMPAGNVSLRAGDAIGSDAHRKTYVITYHANLHDGQKLQDSDGTGSTDTHISSIPSGAVKGTSGGTEVYQQTILSGGGSKVLGNGFSWTAVKTAAAKVMSTLFDTNWDD